MIELLAGGLLLVDVVIKPFRHFLPHFHVLFVHVLESFHGIVLHHVAVGITQLILLGLDSMQSGLKVRSPEDMVSFYETQQSMTQKATDMMMNDAKSYSDMGIKFFNEMRSMYESGVKTSVSAASEAMKA